MEGVLAGQNKKKIKDKRILVIGRFRIFLFERSKKAKNKPKELHFYDLLELETESDIITIKSKDPKSAIFAIISCPNSHQMIQALRSAYSVITREFPPDSLFRIMSTTSDPKAHSTTLEPQDPGIANGLIEVYQAYCDYYKLPASFEFIYAISRLYAQNIVELDLSQVPGIEPKSDTTMHLLPIMASLRHNTYFRAIIANHVTRKDIAVYTADIMRSNTALTKLAFRDINNDEKCWMDLFTSIKHNKYHKLQVLRISDKSIGNKSSIALNATLVEWPHALKVLDLSNCHIQEQGCVALFSALDRNYGMSLTIEELNLSGNSLDKAGSRAFGVWLEHVKAYCKFKKLFLANANFHTSLATSLKSVNTLTELDLTGNKIDGGEGCITVAGICEDNSNLKKLKLASCGLNKDSLEPIWEAILHSVRLSDLELSLAGNSELSGKGITYIAQSMPKMANLLSLDLSNIRMKEKNFIEFLEGVAVTKKIRKLSLSKVISKNGVSSRDKNTDSIAEALLKVIKTNTGIQELDLSEGYGKFIILPILETLQTNQLITSLNVSGNELCDKGAEGIATMLRSNTALTSLSLDKNLFSLNGYKALSISLETNRTLSSIPYPSVDLQKLRQFHNDHPAKLEQLQKVESAILVKLHLNSLNTVQEPQQEADAAPSTIDPHATVPEYLKEVKSDLTFEDVPDFVQNHPQNPRANSMDADTYQQMRKTLDHTNSSTSISSMHAEEDAPPPPPPRDN